jgi:hypothetical protein
MSGKKGDTRADVLALGAGLAACLLDKSQRAALGLDERNMAPGQVLEQPKRKPKLTRDDRIVKAVMTGKGLRQAARETAEMSADEKLGFTAQHLEAMLELLHTEIKAREEMIAALILHGNLTP